MKLLWCKYFVKRWQSHSGFHFCIFDLKDFGDELILIVCETLPQILGATYETVSVPYLTDLGFLE